MGFLGVSRGSLSTLGFLGVSLALGFLWKAWSSIGRLRVPWGRIEVPLSFLVFLGEAWNSLGGLGFLREAWGFFWLLENL